MDINMPILDGYDATTQILKIQEEQENQYTKSKEKFICHIIAITAFLNEKNKSKCFKVGMDEVLHKPVNLVQLKEVFQKYYYKKS